MLYFYLLPNHSREIVHPVGIPLFQKKRRFWGSFWRLKFPFLLKLSIILVSKSTLSI